MVDAHRPAFNSTNLPAVPDMQEEAPMTAKRESAWSTVAIPRCNRFLGTTGVPSGIRPDVRHDNWKSEVPSTANVGSARQK
jgi:hypothetical protein